MNEDHGFLLGQPDGEETNHRPPRPQSDQEEVSHGGVADGTSQHSQIRRQEESVRYKAGKPLRSQDFAGSTTGGGDTGLQPQ